MAWRGAVSPSSQRSTLPKLPPLDAHAHIAAAISAADLDALGAAVVAVTRTPVEWRLVSRRNDSLTVWALGVHPGVPSAIRAYSAGSFRDEVAHRPIVGEVGLDTTSPVEMQRQQQVLVDILQAVADRPRLISLHSRGACGPLLEAIEAHTVRAPVLHWWAGTKAQTARAVDLSCFFSVNGAQPVTLLRQLPRGRIITETDFPFTRRRDPRATRPGEVATVEATLASIWGMTAEAVRVRIWRNFRDALPAEALPLMPSAWRRILGGLGSDAN